MNTRGNQQCKLKCIYLFINLTSVTIGLVMNFLAIPLKKKNPTDTSSAMKIFDEDICELKNKYLTYRGSQTAVDT